MIFDFHDLLAQGVKEIGLGLADEVYDRLYVYFVELKKWNAKVNLVAKRTSDLQLVEKHFLDSLTLLPLLEDSDVHLLDIGTGAGFPGLVCKIARPEMIVTLVEPRLKKVSFLKHVVLTLELTDVQVLACRVEDEDTLDSTEGFTHITCRAVTDISAFLEMTGRFSSSGATLICMKGPLWQEEIAATLELPYVLRKVEERILPFSGARRSLLLFEYK